MAADGLSADLTVSKLLVLILVSAAQIAEIYGWKAGRTSLCGLSFAEKRRRAGVIFEDPSVYLDQPHIMPFKGHKRLVIPDTFDARSAWPQCQSLREIRDQGACGSCWANSGASVISDRICIASGSSHTYFQASVQDILICSGLTTNPCNGGYIKTPCMKFMLDGVVTGGDYQSNSGCMPYTSYTSTVLSSTCIRKCTNAAYAVTYAYDRTFGSNWYGLGNIFENNSGVIAPNATSLSVIQLIQYELMTYGPVSIQITVYSDLFNYKSGVYQKTGGSLVGGHAMKLIGWGTENGTPYWLIANSWGTGWGIGGFVKWLRGANHLKIEDYLVTGRALPVSAQTAAKIPACGDTPESIAFCKGKMVYAMTLPDSAVCSTQACCCPGKCAAWGNTPMLANCPSGMGYDPRPGVDNCVSKWTIPACS